jgi:hypothetical protein
MNKPKHIQGLRITFNTAVAGMAPPEGRRILKSHFCGHFF